MNFLNVTLLLILQSKFYYGCDFDGFEPCEDTEDCEEGFWCDDNKCCVEQDWTVTNPIMTDPCFEFQTQFAISINNISRL